MILIKTLPLLLLQFFLTNTNGGCPHLQQLTPDSTTTGCGQPPTSCPASKYRSYDGSCNNLENPEWGMSQTRYNRLLPANYGDGISAPTVAKSGKPLPSPRAVSVSIYPDVHIENPIWTLITMQYGQIIAHDMSLINVPTTTCCTADGQPLEAPDSSCLPITVSADDPVYSEENITCLPFVRTTTDKDSQCEGGNQAAEQLNGETHYLDLSLVYGTSDQANKQLRAFQGGRLISEQRYNQAWLPRNPNSNTTCTLVDPDEPCYVAGDLRVNQNPQLTVIQTLLFREHNRIADNLAKMNPQWDDETIFQEARKINIGQHQHISYYELLPILIGQLNALENKITWESDSWVNDYDSTVNPSILNEHTTGAYRFFHTLIAGELDLVSELRISSGNVRLSDWFNRPGVLEQGNSFDELTRGLATQAHLGADSYHDKEITNNWSRQPGKQLGQDLKAICIQRNRDHGLASYNDYREFCGLPRASTFLGFLDVISLDNVLRLSQLYEHPDDVDLAAGGSLEAIAPGALVGHTFLCIITEQFHRTRVGDRFWFENSGDGGFTEPQLAEIRKSSIARIICDNSLNIDAMQPKGFNKISLLNLVVPCEALPSVDLSLWKDT